MHSLFTENDKLYVVKKLIMSLLKDNADILLLLDYIILLLLFYVISVIYVIKIIIFLIIIKIITPGALGISNPSNIVLLCIDNDIIILLKEINVKSLQYVNQLINSIFPS